MTTLIQVLTAAALVLTIVIPMAYFFAGKQRNKKDIRDPWQPTAALSSAYCSSRPL